MAYDDTFRTRRAPEPTQGAGEHTTPVTPTPIEAPSNPLSRIHI